MKLSQIYVLRIHAYDDIVRRIEYDHIEYYVSKKLGTPIYYKGIKFVCLFLLRFNIEGTTK